MKKNTSGLKQPFFAGFMESQIKKEATGGIQGGGDPSPTDPTADQYQTMKYPSDQEDNPTPTDKEKDVDQ